MTDVPAVSILFVDLLDLRPSFTPARTAELRPESDIKGKLWVMVLEHQ